MELINLLIFIFIIKTTYSEVFSLYEVTTDTPVLNLQLNQTITLFCKVDLSRGAQRDITWYRRIGKIWHIIGNGDYLYNFFVTSRYILTRESMTKTIIVYSMVIKNLIIEDSGAIYCSGFKNLPLSLTPYILNICNDYDSLYCKCMAKEMSSSCALDMLSKESDNNAMQRACIAIAVCLGVMLLTAIVLTVLVVQRGCRQVDKPNQKSNMEKSLNSEAASADRQLNSEKTMRSIMKEPSAPPAPNYLTEYRQNEITAIRDEHVYNDNYNNIHHSRSVVDLARRLTLDSSRDARHGDNQDSKHPPDRYYQNGSQQGMNSNNNIQRYNLNGSQQNIYSNTDNGQYFLSGSQQNIYSNIDKIELKNIPEGTSLV